MDRSQLTVIPNKTTSTTSTTNLQQQQQQSQLNRPKTSSQASTTIITNTNTNTTTTTIDLSLTLCHLLQRILIPFTLATAVLFRQNLLSAIYLILLLLAPILPSPTAENVINGVNGYYMKIIIGISSIANSAHIITQIVFLSAFNYQTSIDYCTYTGKILNLIGFHRYNDVSFFNIIRLCCMDFIVLLVTCLVLAFSVRTYHSKLSSLGENDGRLHERRFTDVSYVAELSGRRFTDRQTIIPNKRRLKREKAERLSYYICEFIFFVSLCASAILEPSLTSAIYFLYFLFIGSWFALDRPFGTGYHYFRIFIAIFVGLHFSIIFFYQFLMFRPLLPPDNINARLFGLVEYTNNTCYNIRDFNLHEYHFVRFLHPLVLLTLYFVSIKLIRTVLIDKKLSQLLRMNRLNRTYHSVRGRADSMIEPQTLSRISHLNDESSMNLHSQQMSTSLPPSPIPIPTSSNIFNSGKQCRDQSNKFSLFNFELVSLVKRASYVITLIVMMTWSITYHSWLSFVLLLLSCVIWMTPNSRQTCLSSSPFLVFYAIALVIGQYIFSLNLNDDELPVTIGSISISEIGFKKYGEFSYQPLFTKIFYTLFFWVTLRQYTESLKDPITSDTSPGILSPLFNLGPRANTMAPTPDETHQQQQQQQLETQQGLASQSEIFNSMMKCFNEILIKYWIWIVAIMLMVMSLSGSKVVIYRIVYMFLFLIFTLLLLISLKWWRKFIYPFWLIVILYSMIILIAIYTYQFNNFPEYWEHYLHIDKELQEDLGLVVYDNDAFVLFKELLTPTFFIIITIIQVHFVHKDFLEFSNIDEILNRLAMASSRNNSVALDLRLESGQSNVSLNPSLINENNRASTATNTDLKSQPSQSEISVQTVISKRNNNIRPTMMRNYSPSMAKSDSKLSLLTSKPTFAQEVQEIFSKCIRHLRQLIDQWMIVFWRFLEVHIMKAVLLCTVIIAIQDISVMNVIFVFLTIVLMIFSRFEKTICCMFAIWAGILVLLKMLFQLEIAQRIDWYTNCKVDMKMILVDNRAYIGFLKTDDIFTYICEYIALIIILVFRRVIILRQYLYRSQDYGDRPLFEGVIFPDVDRPMADKDFASFFKFLLNFGFYKFGVEICLILMTITTGNHGDIFSVLYCLLLIAFVLFNRVECQRFWSYLVGFMAIVLPYQYLMCLGMAPGLCWLYPWHHLPQADLDWYFLPDFKHQLPKQKLYLDFLLFFCLCRQLLYFRLESKLSQYGGSNLEAYKEQTPPNVFDCFSFGTSLFDSFKSYFLFCFFWITLAVLFLAGTTRINLFGLGYVLGSFIFLWNGNEFYLKPMKMIFKSWKTIIGYTCLAMLLKSILQVFVLTLLRNNMCWAVQLMGLSYHQRDINWFDPATKELFDKCPSTDSGLLWDGICFTFLLIQKRIFCSHYFKYLIRETKAQQFLAARGAELIHEIQAQEVAEQEIAEREVMEKIKQKMDRIKEAQQRMFANQARSIKYHKQAVKSGGYYMFEDGDTEVCDLNYKTRESLIPDPEGDEIRNIARSKGFTAFCSKIFKGEDTSEAPFVSDEITDIGESSHDSPIISVERIKRNPDSSRPTTMTSVPDSQATDFSAFSSLVCSVPAHIDQPIPEDQQQQQHQKTIKQESEKSYSLESDEQQEPTYMEKIRSWFDFFKTFTESIFISSTSNLNAVSRDYRFVAKRLAVEKKCLKKIIEIKELDGIQYDFIGDQIWKKNTLAKLSKLTEKSLEDVAKSDANDVLRVWSDLDATSTDTNKHLYHVSLDSRYMETSIYIHFFRAIFYAILSRSEVICYITIVINQITSASILSIPLPMLTFLWGSLSVPRPSKSFWVTCITYIEIVVVLKYVFQFHFWPWIELAKPSPFWWPRLLGIEKKDNYANYDLVLLLVLFFHRFMLKSLGLWDLSETEIKAYMTNAELFQTRIEDDDEFPEINPANNGKKSKHSKKKSSSGKKNKSSQKTVQEKPSEEQQKQQQQQEISSDDQIDPSSMMMIAPLPPPLPEQHLYENELMQQEDDEVSEGDEINFIYFLMEIPTRTRKKFIANVSPVYKFFHNVLHPPYRITHDVYALMFLCDFINFFILVFGFYAFGSGYSGSEDVARFLEENKIPIGFLITLLIQFAQIIVDRAIYLRKYIKGKLLFQIFIVIFTHMWLFFVLPAMTDKAFTDKTNLPPKLWYIFKCIYFLLSAFQIRSGYPTRILGNTFCKKYNFVNWYLFKVYMLIPFVYDLRMYMDWIWTDTSLVLDEWSLMEDIFVNLYQRKCELRLDEEFPEPRGRAKKRFFKYLIGGSWVIIIIALIWGPLVLFAFGRAVGEINPPIGATFELEIGGYQPLFKMSVTDSGLVPISDQKWSKLSSSFNRDPVAQTFINGYDQQDVYIVNLNGNSTAVWGISPPSLKILQNELLSNQAPLNMKLTYFLTRKKTKTQDMDTSIYDEYLIELHPHKDKDLRVKLADMISRSEEQSPAIIPHIFPNYLRAPEKGKPIVVTELAQKNYGLHQSQMSKNKSMNFRNLLILLKKGDYEDNSSMTSWWEIHDDCQNTDYLDPFLKNLMITEHCQFLPVIVFNDKVFIGLLAFLSGYGIIGIYTTFVFLVSRWVRGLNSESSFKVIYTRMPNVDRVLQLCLDIYLVRESREFELEEDLYAKLIFLYRSPETLIKWTKISEEIASVPSNQNQQQQKNDQE
ncbi:piezo type mechanosensitive ion channel component isoform X2 [Dermatophagoides pteronyssinus]|uniref:piezo type mechanosensitive ion channel component isoform X2 n=1 Tax=Dermatophagoides pteronyssinus TaxID=6956 RepID=UPI003F66B168